LDLTIPSALAAVVAAAVDYRRAGAVQLILHPAASPLLFVVTPVLAVQLWSLAAATTFLTMAARLA
jgi:hypothetical protein